MFNQKQAVVSTILAVLVARDVDYELGGPIAISEVLTDADKKEVRSTLFNMFREGEVSFKDSFQVKCDDDAELKKYISGLLNNWIRKNPEFNSGNKYVAKNPGSRAGSSDSQMQALKKLLVQVTAEGDDTNIAEVKEAIELRKTEIKPKASATPIKVEALPEHLRHLVPSSSSEETTTEESEEVLD